MSSYVRPSVTEQTYRDADGAVIEYGNRWGSQGPPADSYSVATHPERFAPLHQIADALIDYLQRRYDVEVTDDLSCAQDLRNRMDAVRAVRLTPTASDAAPLTFVLTDYPGVIVHAGLLNDFCYPVCGCDACDESWESVAEELEWNVQAVAAGGYREDVDGTVSEPTIGYQLKAADGSRIAGRRVNATCDVGTLRTASARLNALAGDGPPGRTGSCSRGTGKSPGGLREAEPATPQRGMRFGGLPATH